MLSTSVASVAAEKFPIWLQRQLDRREWRAAELARRLDISPGVVSHWLNGQRLPSPASCDRIADVFGLPVDDVLTLAGHRPATEPIKPDDPRTEFIGLVKRVRWTPERVAMMRSILTGMVEYDRKERGGA